MGADSILPRLPLSARPQDRARRPQYLVTGGNWSYATAQVYLDDRIMGRGSQATGCNVLLKNNCPATVEPGTEYRQWLSTVCRPSRKEIILVLNLARVCEPSEGKRQIKCTRSGQIPDPVVYTGIAPLILFLFNRLRLLAAQASGVASRDY